MGDLNNDVRIAVDTGKVSLGHRSVVRAISEDSAKVIIVAEKGKKEMVDDIMHMCKVADVKVIKFAGGSADLGAVCGKPYSVNSLAVIDPGNSDIINDA